VGMGAIAARPSCEEISGGPSARDTTRFRADSAAVRSAGVSGPPSRRETTRMAGMSSPPGNDSNNAAALADSADGGSCSGGLSAPVFAPPSAMNTPAPTAINSATTQERRCVTTAATWSHPAIPER
jgi:hypothetical protein